MNGFLLKALLQRSVSLISAQGELGDIVYVEVETEGETLEQEAILNGGSVKRFQTFTCPYLEKLWSSTPSEKWALKSKPDPYGDGWMVKVKISESRTIDGLLDDAAYKALIGDKAFLFLCHCLPWVHITVLMVLPTSDFVPRGNYLIWTKWSMQEFIFPYLFWGFVLFRKVFHEKHLIYSLLYCYLFMVWLLK